MISVEIPNISAYQRCIKTPAGPDRRLTELTNGHRKSLQHQHRDQSMPPVGGVKPRAGQGGKKPPGRGDVMSFWRLMDGGAPLRFRVHLN